MCYFSGNVVEVWIDLIFILLNVLIEFTTEIIYA